MADYYELLGVPPEATADDIKKAYKKRALEWHPDRPTGSAEKFKQLVDAYNVLNDPEARKNYDRRRNSNPATFASKFSQVASAASTTAKKVVTDFVDDGLFDTLDKFLGRKKEPKNIEIEIKITLEELYEGADKQVFFKRMEACDVCEGRGAERKEDIKLCVECYGVGHTVSVSNLASLFSKEDCKRCKGAGKIITQKCSGCKGKGEKKYDREFTFPIPKDLNLGVDKDRLVLPGEGEYGGDLLIQVDLKPHKYYEVSWPDLSVELPIQFYQAILGDYLEIDTLRGPALFKVPPGTEHNEQIVLKNYGLRKTDQAGNTKFGDLNVKLQIAIPKRLTKEQRKLLEDYRDLERTKSKNKPSSDP